jgi:hypothetical protein
MSSAPTTSSIHRPAERQRDLARHLRHPSERRALALCILANLFVVAIAIGIVLSGTAWLSLHPRLAEHTHELRIVAIAAVIALPAAFVGRHFAYSEARANGVRATAEAYPELHAALVRISGVLGFERRPELYLGHVEGGPAMVHSMFGARPCVVLNAEMLFAKDWAADLPWISFVLASALGALLLGHTHWWIELFTAYARRIPGLRGPLLIAWTYSRDRCAAYAVPEGVRGLLVRVVGKNMVSNIDVASLINQPESRGLWARLSSLRQKAPHLVDRIAALADAGLLEQLRRPTP